MVLRSKISLKFQKERIYAFIFMLRNSQIVNPLKKWKLRTTYLINYNSYFLFLTSSNISFLNLGYNGFVILCLLKSIIQFRKNCRSHLPQFSISPK